MANLDCSAQTRARNGVPGHAERGLIGEATSADREKPARPGLDSDWKARDTPSSNRDSSTERAGTVGGKTRTSSPLVELTVSELPAFCPNPAMTLWESHPRVYLDVVNASEAMCPYCGTRYRLKCRTRAPGHGYAAGDFRGRREPQSVRSQTAWAPVPRLRDSGETANLTADALGNTTLELMTQWLRRRR